jgi:hypothetical protein
MKKLLLILLSITSIQALEKKTTTFRNCDIEFYKAIIKDNLLLKNWIKKQTTLKPIIDFVEYLTGDYDNQIKILNELSSKERDEIIRILEIKPKANKNNSDNVKKEEVPQQTKEIFVDIKETVEFLKELPESEQREAINAFLPEDQVKLLAELKLS